VRRGSHRAGALRAAVAACCVALGVAAGYAIWGRTPDWFAARDLAALPPGGKTDLIRYGQQLVTETPRLIGPDAADAAKRFAGNNLACTNCHMKAGLQPFAAPLVSTFTSFPLMVDDRVVTLTDRINGCMTRSMNGKALPVESREMRGFLAYIEFLGHGTPGGQRVPGMGLEALATAPQTPSAGRGEAVYAASCARCHGAGGAGKYRGTDPGDGYAFPPLWGEASFNAAAGMSRLTMAASFIHANMPFGVDQGAPPLAVQAAWDAAAFMIAQPRPTGPPRGD
jgi:thiosulfate dehydrogenase